MCMLGVVFARFSAPFKRAQGIRFSAVATVSRHPSGFWAVTYRCVWVCIHLFAQHDTNRHFLFDGTAGCQRI